jgi:hypothetical protein
VILFGIGIGIAIAIDIAISSSHVRHPFRPRQRLRSRLRCRCRMRHTGVGYLVALGTPERLSLPGSRDNDQSDDQWLPNAFRSAIPNVGLVTREK